MIHSGMMLARISRAAFSQLFDAEGRSVHAMADRNLRPLFENSARAGIRERFTGADDREWVVFSAPYTGENPWDIAHREAGNGKHSFAKKLAAGPVYVEPDILHETVADLSDEVISPDYPPGPSDSANAGWHLAPGYTDFASARLLADGTGIRIAHLDTGYLVDKDGHLHPSAPAKLRTKLGWNYVEENDKAVDPGDEGLLLMPWHGTATMALLAGTDIDYDFRYNSQPFKGKIGGAPGAEVVPVRISRSVIHLFTRNMARGIDYALAPRADAANCCDVLSISAGGLPSLAWAKAVNRAYAAGIVIVAAAGNSFRILGMDIPTHQTLWPARFSHVVSAHGATFAKTPYTTTKNGVMQGCWGPSSVMAKGVTAFTPNVYYAHGIKSLEGDITEQESMDFGGTSSAAPQIAAACALWLEKYGLPRGPARVDACVQALFASATPTRDSLHFGRGLLNANEMLKHPPAVNAAGEAAPPDADVVSPYLDALFPGSRRSELGKMYEVEAEQLFAATRNRKLADSIAEFGEGRAPPSSAVKDLRDAVIAEPAISIKLRDYLAGMAAKKRPAAGRKASVRKPAAKPRRR